MTMGHQLSCRVLLCQGVRREIHLHCRSTSSCVWVKRLGVGQPTSSHTAGALTWTRARSPSPAATHMFFSARVGTGIVSR